MPLMDTLRDGLDRIIPSGGSRHSIPATTTGISSMGSGGIGHARFEDDVRLSSDTFHAFPSCPGKAAKASPELR